MKFKTAFFLLFLISAASAQVVFEPLHSDVYNFLSRLSQKGLIEFNDNIRPVTRQYIYSLLKEAELKRNELTRLEKDELFFFLQDYYQESRNDYLPDDLHKLFTGVGKDPAGRYRLFAYSDDLFRVNLSPILGYSYGKRDGLRNNHLWNGLYFYGYIGDQIGFSFDFRDNNETGKGIDPFKLFTPETGVNFRGKPNSIDYSEAKATISTNWSWGSFTIGKDFLEWGYGKSGLIVLSQKAPSFPFIRLEVKPVTWFRFNYMHAWLSSDVIDSTESYFTLNASERIVYRDKFLATHTATITPFEGFDIALGESIIYSDKLEIAYLIPLSFFRLVDHAISRQNNSAGSNAQFFFQLSSRNHIPNTHLYGSLFIDEITLENIFDKVNQRNQLGFTLGGSVTDLPLENLTIRTEYTKIYPFVYSHFITTQTYESSSFPLGHWMGYNADLIYGELNYRILRGLQADIFAQYIRKGSKGTVTQQYIQPQPPFLFGLRKDYTYLGFSVKYEFIHELFAKFNFQNININEEQSEDIFVEQNFNEFSFVLYYGL
ncbi:MAG: hypothetical protein Kow0098_02380 [Ignavibacteriaceae bacterium]